MLEAGQPFVLDAETDSPGDAHRVGLDYKDLVRDVEPGAVLLLDDGLIRLTVQSIDGPRIVTRVDVGGRCRTTRASTGWAAGCRRRR